MSTTTLLSLDAVTVAGYRARTGDATTTDDAVTGALVEAESLLEEELRRLLPLMSRTETMRIERDTRMYPKAWPIVACESNVIDGRSLFGGLPDVNQYVALIGLSPALAPRATITYTGGFDADTLPLTLAHAIYDLAHSLAVEGTPVLAGSTVSVGDVSISGIPSPGDIAIDAYVPGLSGRVARYKNRFVG